MGKLNSVTLVILAGGENSRMGVSGKITPKSLMSVFDETIIIRHLRHAKEAKINNVIISTNNKIYKRMRECLKYWGYSDVKVINNPNHKYGSLSALHKAINSSKPGNTIMSFADIFFLKNPYIKFANQRAGSNFLGISPVFIQKDLSMGGIVFVQGKFIRKIIEDPIKNNKSGVRWNGLAFFSNSLKNELGRFLKNNKMHMPEGYFFDYIIKAGVIFNTCKCSDFININRPQDILSASLYRYSELSKSKSIRLVAEKIRKDYIKSFHKFNG